MSRPWPATLPPFDVAGYQRQPRPSGVRFEPEFGPAHQRRRTRAAGQRLTLRLSLTSAQRATFWTFWRDTCAEGALTFDRADPVEGTASRWAWDLTQPPVEQVEAPYFVVAFTLDRLP